MKKALLSISVLAVAATVAVRVMSDGESALPAKQRDVVPRSSVSEAERRDSDDVLADLTKLPVDRRGARHSRPDEDESHVASSLDRSSVFALLGGEELLPGVTFDDLKSDYDYEGSNPVRRAIIARSSKLGTDVLAQQPWLRDQSLQAADVESLVEQGALVLCGQHPPTRIGRRVYFPCPPDRAAEVEDLRTALSIVCTSPDYRAAVEGRAMAAAKESDPDGVFQIYYLPGGLDFEVRDAGGKRVAGHFERVPGTGR